MSLEGVLMEPEQHLAYLVETIGHLVEDMRNNHHHKKGSQLMTIATGSRVFFNFANAWNEARWHLDGTEDKYKDATYGT